MAEKEKFLKAKGDVTVITAIYYLRVNQAYSVSPWSGIEFKYSEVSIQKPGNCIFASSQYHVDVSVCCISNIYNIETWAILKSQPEPER